MIDEKDQKMLDICKKCNGYCCTRPIISKYEYDHLKKAGYKDFAEREGVIFKIKANEQRCIFLRENGCKLPQKLRPLECKIFPMRFNIIKSSLNFYFYPKELCPYVEEFKRNEIWMNETKKLFNNKIKKWSAEEIESFTKKRTRLKLKIYGLMKVIKQNFQKKVRSKIK
ncbi:MAG: YkgJ family cysteine cluster protein [Thermoplasmatales archaeon]|nr:YkgJ family cysteine cluster protein [Thermoplasmatales archaeon]